MILLMIIAGILLSVLFWHVLGLFVFQYFKSMPFWLYVILKKHLDMGLWVNQTWDPDKCGRDVNLNICHNFFKNMTTDNKKKFVVELDSLGFIDWEDFYNSYRFGEIAVRAGLWRKFPKDFGWFDSSIRAIKIDDLVEMWKTFDKRFGQQVCWYYPFTLEELKNLLNSGVCFYEDWYYNILINTEITSECQEYVRRYLANRSIPEDAIRLADDLWLKDGELYEGNRD